MSAARILLASRSAGKLRELRPMIEGSGWTVTDLSDAGVPILADEDAIEAWETFEDNALAKARHFFARTGQPTLADDSGLEVAALDGAPGVRSRRWSGRADLDGEALDAANNAHLIERLRRTGSSDRRARYVCVAAYVDGTRELHARGEVSGRLLEEPRGTAGFGYDPYFVPDEGDGRTFGEMSREEKARLSHRGRAVTALLRQLARESEESGDAGSARGNGRLPP